jgi:hypothetical protein
MQGNNQFILNILILAICNSVNLYKFCSDLPNDCITNDHMKGLALFWKHKFKLFAAHPLNDTAVGPLNG